jgi:hypothetical protein
MPTYLVTFPVVGGLTFTVDAENEKSAVEKAWEIDWGAEITGPNEHGIEFVDLDRVEVVSRGNVCYAPINKIEVEDVS